MLQFSLLQGLFSLWNIMEQHRVSNVLRRDVLTSGTRFTSQLSLYVSIFFDVQPSNHVTLHLLVRLKLDFTISTGKER